MRPSGSPGRPQGRWRCSPATSVTLSVNAIASAMGGQDGLAEGLAVGLASGEDTATDVWPPTGTAALAEFNCQAAPASAPSTNPPVMAATFVIFIVAGTTRAAQVLVRNGCTGPLK